MDEKGNINIRNSSENHNTECDIDFDFSLPSSEESVQPVHLLQDAPRKNIRAPSPVDFFPDEPGVTDIIFIVEDRKIHVSKSVLIQASPVFKAMFTLEFKEKEASEIPLPEKNYETFALFLRCILPKEYIELDEMKIADVLPLAHEYDVSCIKEECQWWLLNDIHIRLIKKDGDNFMQDVEEHIDFFVKCMYYGSEYQLDLLYKTALEEVVLHKASRYWDNEYYKMMGEKHKCELLETRVKKLEGSVENLKYGKLLQERLKLPGIAFGQNQGLTKKKSCGVTKSAPQPTISSIISKPESTLKVHSKYFL